MDFFSLVNGGWVFDKNQSVDFSEYISIQGTTRWQDGMTQSHYCSSYVYFIYLFLPVFSTPTALRAFELLTRYKWSQFSTNLRQCLHMSNSASIGLSFSITPFILSIFPLS